MTKTQNIVVCAGLALACGIALRSAFWKSDKTAAAPQPGATLLAQNNLKPTEASNQTVAAASATPAAPVAQPVKSPPAIAENDAGAGLGADGRQVTPTDKKGMPPPVGMFLPMHPSAVDLGNGDPATEFLNKTKSSSSSIQLLDAPNPQNVDGPVVSPETR
jgi:hypothetical protein